MMGQGSGGGGRLPAEYQEVEYIESTGTQWINTGQKYTIFSKIHTKVAQHAINTVVAMGARPGSYIEPGGLVFTTGGATGSAAGTVFFQANNRSTYDIRTFNDTDIHTIDIELCNLDIDGARIVTSPFVFDGTPPNFYLFTFSNVNAPVVGFASKLYIAEFSRSTNSAPSEFTPSQIFIPCYRKSDNVAGMYDLCGSICPLTNSPFYTNAGSGTFIVGPNV